MHRAYILNIRPFRETSFIVDLLTENVGRLHCMARVSKKRGKILRGNLQPFSLMDIHWRGKGQLPTLTLLEEKKRYALPHALLSMGLYFNELIYRLLPLHIPATEVYLAYQRLLNELTQFNSALSRYSCLILEVELLQALEIIDSIHYDNHKQQAIDDASHYNYIPDEGLQLHHNGQNAGIFIRGKLWNQLQTRQINDNNWLEIRYFMDQLINVSLKGKKLNSRVLIANQLKNKVSFT